MKVSGVEMSDVPRSLALLMGIDGYETPYMISH